MKQPIPEIDLSAFGIKDPRKGNLVRNTKRQRAKIEEELGEKWDKVEEKLYNKITESMGNRHSLIRESHQCMAVAEMLLAKEQLKTVLIFIRERDPYRFSEAKISTSALRQQIIRFGHEVIQVLDECDEEGFNPLDLYARLNGKLASPIAMMERVLVLQEHRLCIALFEEDREIQNLMLDDPTSAQYQKKYKRIMKNTGRQLDLYWKILLGYAMYERLQEPDQNVQRWMKSDIREFRECMPLSIKRYTA